MNPLKPVCFLNVNYVKESIEAMVGVGKKTKTAARTAFDLAVKKGVPDSLIHQLYRCGALNLGVGIWDEWEFFFF